MHGLFWTIWNDELPWWFRIQTSPLCDVPTNCLPFSCPDDDNVWLGDCVLDHVEAWEEGSSRRMAKKRVIGRCCATPAPEEAYVTMPRIINIGARMNKVAKECLEDLYKECEWQTLCERGYYVGKVWVDELRFNWDSSLGCGDRPWLASLTLVISSC